MDAAQRVRSLAANWTKMLCRWGQDTYQFFAAHDAPKLEWQLAALHVGRITKWRRRHAGVINKIAAR
jgi:hypothetical protein